MSSKRKKYIIVDIDTFIKIKALMSKLNNSYIGKLHGKELDEKRLKNYYDLSCKDAFDIYQKIRLVSVVAAGRRCKKCGGKFDPKNLCDVCLGNGQSIRWNKAPKSGAAYIYSGKEIFVVKGSYNWATFYYKSDPDTEFKVSADVFKKNVESIVDNGLGV